MYREVWNKVASSVKSALKCFFIANKNSKRLQQMHSNFNIPESFKSFKNKISKLAIVSSFVIFHAKNQPSWENLPTLNPIWETIMNNKLWCSRNIDCLLYLRICFILLLLFLFNLILAISPSLPFTSPFHHMSIPCTVSSSTCGFWVSITHHILCCIQ